MWSKGNNKTYHIITGDFSFYSIKMRIKDEENDKKEPITISMNRTFVNSDKTIIFIIIIVALIIDSKICNVNLKENKEIDVKHYKYEEILSELKDIRSEYSSFKTTIDQVISNSKTLQKTSGDYKILRNQTEDYELLQISFKKATEDLKDKTGAYESLQINFKKMAEDYKSLQISFKEAIEDLKDQTEDYKTLQKRCEKSTKVYEKYSNERDIQPYSFLILLLLVFFMWVGLVILMREYCGDYSK